MNAAWKKQSRLLSLDSLGAILAGVLTLVLFPWLQSLYQWTPGFTLYIAFANIVYGLYSGYVLSVHRVAQKSGQVPFKRVAVLVVANGLWATQCFYQAIRLHQETSLWGLGHLVLEGFYVGLLAYLEMKAFFIQRSALNIAAR